MSIDQGDDTFSQPMALLEPHNLDAATLESAPKSTTAYDVNELWNLIEETETTTLKCPDPGQSVHPEVENAKSTFVLPDFADMTLLDKDFWKFFETMPQENASDEVFAAHGPAMLAPPSLHSASPSTPPLAPNKSGPHALTPVPSPTSQGPTSSLPPGSLQPGQICPKLNIIFGSIKKESPIKEAKTKRKGQRSKKQPNSAPANNPSGTQNQQINFLGWLNGQQLFKAKEGHQDSDSDEDAQVYIKKPPNAFMLFMKEQRPSVSKELWRKGSGAVNSHLASIWRSMSKEEQATYFSEADRLNTLHKLKYPNWSNQMNYGKKRRRDRRQSGVSSLESNFVKIEPRQPGHVMQGHTQSIMMQPPIQHGAYIPDPHAQGPFLPYDLPQGPYMWNPHLPSPFLQSHLPQGPGMLNPHQPGPYVQNAQAQGPYMYNPNAQGPFMLNSYSQGPYMHTSHSQGPFMMNYYGQGPYLYNPHSQAPNMNYPHSEGPYMNNPVPQRPLHYPEGIYMHNQQSQVDCKPNQQPQMECMLNQQPQAYPPTQSCETEGDYVGSNRNVPGPS